MGRGRARIALPRALRALWGRCSRTSRGIAPAIGCEQGVRAPLRGSVALREHRPQQFGEARAVAPIGQAHPTEHPTVAHDAESILASVAQRAGAVPLARRCVSGRAPQAIPRASATARGQAAGAPSSVFRVRQSRHFGRAQSHAAPGPDATSGRAGCIASHRIRVRRRSQLPPSVPRSSCRSRSWATRLRAY